MEMKELLDCYLAGVGETNKNLVRIAFDEMSSSQYEEAAACFGQLYSQDSHDYMSYFFRAYCKSHCGTRGDVYPDSQIFTSAFQSACEKAFNAGGDLNTNLCLLFTMYENAMGNLAENAVEEVHVNSNGDTYTKNPIKKMIYADCVRNLVKVMQEKVALIKGYEKAQEYVITYLKANVDKNLKLYGPALLAYEPEYAATLEAKMKQAKIKKWIIAGVIVAVLVILTIAMM
jgi:hypothetical protein